MSAPSETMITNIMNYMSYFHRSFMAHKGGIVLKIVPDQGVDLLAARICLAMIGVTSGVFEDMTGAVVVSGSHVPAQAVVPYYEPFIFHANTNANPHYFGANLYPTLYAQPSYVPVFAQARIYTSGANDFCFGMQIGPPTTTTAFLATGTP